MEADVKKKVEVVHPYIAKREEGEHKVAIVAGTGVHVWAIIGYSKLGMSVEEISEALPHLTLAQIHDAFSYYYDHQGEIEEDLARIQLSDEEAEERQAMFNALFRR
jgi:uncharacterized protein (DUF433 family)